MFNLLLLLSSTTLVYGQWMMITPDGPPIFSTDADAYIPPRRNCAMWCVDKDIYVFSGTTGEHILEDMWKYELDTRRWFWMPNPPSVVIGVKEPAYWTIQNDLYMYGGQSVNYGVLDHTWMYTPGTREWRRLPNAPIARYGAAFWAHKASKRLFLYGGHDGNSTCDDLWEFNIKTLEWREIHYGGTGPGPHKDGRAVLGNSEDTVYFFTMELYQLDITTMTWSKSPAGPSPSGGGAGPKERTNHIMFMSPTQDKITVSGGHLGAKLYTDSWVYDPSSGGGVGWTEDEKRGGPNGRWGACSCVDAQNHFYMFGGTYEDPTHLHNDLWKNGPLTGTDILTLLNFKLDTVTLSSMLAAAMSTMLMSILFILMLCVCVRKCRASNNVKSYNNSPLVGEL
jgi:hypothetical protein